MKAIVVHQHGGPEVLSLEDVPAPQPKPGEVLVRAFAIGVGKPDALVRAGTHKWLPPLPLIPGIEMVGHVQALGDGVTHFKPGQPVYVLHVAGGCYADMVLVPASAVTPLPDHCDPEVAVGTLNYLLAWGMLHDMGHAEPGQSIYLTGASGGAGTALIHVAKLAGLRVIAGASSAEKCAFAMSQGADHAVDYSREDEVTAVSEFTSGQGVNLVLDHFVGPHFGRLFKMLAPFGQVITYNRTGGLPQRNVMEDMLPYLTKSPALRYFSLRTYDALPGRQEALMKTVMDLLTNGSVKPHVSRRFKLADAADAHRLLDAGQVRAKVLLLPSTR